MFSSRLSTLIIENIPSLTDRAILKEDLRESVKEDCLNLNIQFKQKDFSSSLQHLHDQQLIFIFENGFIKMTGMGKHRLR